MQRSIGAFGFTRNGAAIPAEPAESPEREDESNNEEEGGDEGDEDANPPLPKDDITLMPPALWPRHATWRIVVSCTLHALIGHMSVPNFVLYDATRCVPAALKAMNEITRAEPRELSNDTLRYIVRGPRAVSPARKVDPRIRAYTRRQLGLFLIAYDSVNVVVDEEETGHSFDLDSSSDEMES